MAVLWQKIKLGGSRGEVEINPLFDSGTTYSIIKKDIAQKIALIDKLPDPIRFNAVNQKAGLIISEAIRADFYLDGTRFSDEFLVADDITEDVIIGAGTMQRWRFKLDFENERVVFDPNVTKLVVI